MFPHEQYIWCIHCPFRLLPTEDGRKGTLSTILNSILYRNLILLQINHYQFQKQNGCILATVKSSFSPFHTIFIKVNSAMHGTLRQWYKHHLLIKLFDF